ncbi:MAG: Hsp70 family protein, partial [Burkholderiales bacterium]|nr:Hsp70 family protein [Burkholderiales bacterium]
SAKDKATGKENKIKITASSGLAEDEIQRMVKDAEVNAEEDRKARELVDARNQCDAMVHTVRKSLAEHGDKLESGEKAQIEEALKAAEEAMKGGDKSTIEAKTQALTQAAQKLGEKMYAQQQDAAGGEQASGAKAAHGDDSDVVDAEFEEVKDKK